MAAHPDRIAGMDRRINAMVTLVSCRKSPNLSVAANCSSVVG
jgi:hypothetical protein